MDSDEINYIRQIVDTQAGQECRLSATFAMLKGLLATMDMLRQLLDRTAAPQVAPAASQLWVCGRAETCPDPQCHGASKPHYHDSPNDLIDFCPLQEDAYSRCIPYTPPAAPAAPAPVSVPHPHGVVLALRGLLDILNAHGATDGSDYESAVINRREIARQALAQYDAGDTPAPTRPSANIDAVAAFREFLEELEKIQSVPFLERLSSGGGVTVDGLMSRAYSTLKEIGYGETPAPNAAPPSSEVVAALRYLLEVVREDASCKPGSDLDYGIDEAAKALEEFDTTARLDAGETPAPNQAPRTAAEAARMARMLREYSRDQEREAHELGEHLQQSTVKWYIEEDREKINKRVADDMDFAVPCLEQLAQIEEAAK